MRTIALVCIALLVQVPFIIGQTATTVRNAHIRQLPDGNSLSLEKLEPGIEVKLLSDRDTLGYYRVVSHSGRTGYVYRTLARLRQGDPKWFISPEAPAVRSGLLNACSFNIKFLGSSKSRDNARLVDLMSPYDLVIVQELVAPPTDGQYPNGTAYDADLEAAQFFDLMNESGFIYYLSPENTGPEKNHAAGSSAEWSVVFYRDEVLRIDSSRCRFIQAPLVRNATFDRVPFRFQFSTVDNTLDFSIINVHLASDEGAVAKRKNEMQAIAAYATSEWGNEQDFIVVGDMNFQTCNEYMAAMPQQWVSLNDQCAITNVAASRNPDNKKPYDHVVYFPQYTAHEFDLIYDIKVIDIFELFYPAWAAQNPNKAASSSWATSFGAAYSDHHPIAFRMVYGVGDDD